MLVQQQALLGTEGLDVHFTDAAIQEISAVAAEVRSNMLLLHTRLTGVVSISATFEFICLRFWNDSGDNLDCSGYRPLIL
eukprot:2473564-Pyramimonas_sp.AAC.1